MKKKITFVNTVVHPQVRDGNDYTYIFTVENTVNKNQSIHKIQVGISGTLITQWQNHQENINFEKVCYEYAKNEVVRLLRSKNLLANHRIEILSNTHPKTCPFNMENIAYQKGSSFIVDAE